MAELGAGAGSGYPAVLDTDTNQEMNSPNAGRTKARAEVPNDLAAAIIAIETELGTDPAGTLTNVKTFLQTEHNTNGTHKDYSFSVHRNGVDQSLPIATYTKIAWTTEEFDTNNNFDSTTNYRFTPTVAGKYLLSAAYVVNTNPVTVTGVEIHVYKNGVSYKNARDIIQSGQGNDGPGISVVVDANGTTDYFEIFAYDTARADTIAGAITATWFTGCRV